MNDAKWLSINTMLPGCELLSSSKSGTKSSSFNKIYIRVNNTRNWNAMGYAIARMYTINKILVKNKKLT